MSGKTQYSQFVRDVEESRIPWTFEGEKALLSSMLQDESVIDDFAHMRDGYFHFPAHGVIFSKMLEMRAMGSPVDLVTLTESLRVCGELEGVGGAAAIGELFVFVPGASNADYYARLVQDKAVRRRVMAVSQKLARRAVEDECLPEELLQDAEAALLQLRNQTEGETSWQTLKKGILDAVNQVELTYQNRGQPVGLATGLVDFDRMTGGLKPGQLMIVAARPGMGKTCFILQAAREFANRVPVAIFSLEMNVVELASRTLCSETPLNLARLRDGFMGRSDIPRIHQAATTLSNLPVFIDETPALSIFELRSRARRAVIKHGVGAIFVDYLQLLRGTSKRAQENRAQEVAEISMALKACSKELKVPVIAAAQLNRDAEHRAGPPKLADLRESGQIEQDADLVVFLHRPKKDSKDSEERQEMQLIVAKHRDGPVNSVPLRFIGEFARFENVTEKLYSNNPSQRQGGEN